MSTRENICLIARAPLRLNKHCFFRIRAEHQNDYFIYCVDLYKQSPV